MSKPNERKKMVAIPAFDYKIHIIFTDDVIASRKKIGRLIGDTFSGAAEAYHVYTDAPESWLIFPHEVTPGTISHEAYHCIRRVMEWIGADSENEVMAYHLEWLVNEVWWFLR